MEWAVDWNVELGLELGNWIGTWRLELGSELGLDRNLDRVLKFGRFKQLKVLKPCYTIRRPAEADYKLDNCNAKNKCLANSVVMQHQGELCRADPTSQTTSLKTVVIYRFKSLAM